MVGRLLVDIIILLFAAGACGSTISCFGNRGQSLAFSYSFWIFSCSVVVATSGPAFGNHVRRVVGVGAKE
jgi:hypothetical protein